MRRTILSANLTNLMLQSSSLRTKEMHIFLIYTQDIYIRWTIPGHETNLNKFKVIQDKKITF